MASEQRIYLTREEIEFSDDPEWMRVKEEIAGLLVRVETLAMERLGDEAFAWHDKRFVDHAKEIRLIVPDCCDYVAWHKFIGSTVFYEMSPKLDLPEPYSIKAYLDSLVRELMETPNR